MKKLHLILHHSVLPACALTVLGLSAAVLTAQDGPTVIKSADGQSTTVVVPGAAPAEATSPSEVVAIKKLLRTGVRVSNDTFAKLQAVPETLMQSLEDVDEEMAYRYIGGTIYVIEPNTYKVKNVIVIPESDKPVGIETEDHHGSLSEADLLAFREALIVGYEIPKERYVYLRPVPEPVVKTLDPLPDGKTYRYLDGTIYTVDVKSYTVVDVTKLSADDSVTTSRKMLSDDEAAEFQRTLVKGYQVPENQVVYFQEIPETVVEVLPAPVTDTEYRYLNGVVYTVDPFTNRILDAKTVAEITALDQ